MNSRLLLVCRTFPRERTHADTRNVGIRGEGRPRRAIHRGADYGSLAQLHEHRWSISRLDWGQKLNFVVWTSTSLNNKPVRVGLGR